MRALEADQQAARSTTSIPATRPVPGDRRQYVRVAPQPPVRQPYVAPIARPRRRRRWASVLLVGCLLLAGLYTGISAVRSLAAQSQPRHGVTVAAGADTSGARSWFQTPSRNIVCIAAGSTLRCDINTVYYGTPPVPTACRKTPNWGHVVTIDGHGAHLVCPKIRITAGGAVCSSSTEHLQCRRGAHGFELSRARYRVW